MVSSEELFAGTVREFTYYLGDVHSGACRIGACVKIYFVFLKTALPALAVAFQSIARFKMRSSLRFHAADRALWRAVSAAEEMEALTYRVLIWVYYFIVLSGASFFRYYFELFFFDVIDEFPE